MSERGSTRSEVAGLHDDNLIERGLQQMCLPVNIAIFLRARKFKEHLRTTASQTAVLKNTREQLFVY